MPDNRDLERGYTLHPIPWKIIKDPRVKQKLIEERKRKRIAELRAKGKLKTF